MDQVDKPLRVLHISNIANNAFLNAKLLNEAGLDCDVICHNYYHVMGAPEWEEAEITGEIRDQNFPNWAAVNLHGYQRPAWFAQGPVRMCIRYLVARHHGQRWRARYWWQLMVFYRWIFSGPLQRLLSLSPIVMRGSRFLAHSLRRVVNLTRYIKLSLFRLRRTIYLLIRRGPRWTAKYIMARLRGAPPEYTTVADVPPTEAKVGAAPLATFDQRSTELAQQFTQVFPERADQLSARELLGWSSIYPWWKELFAEYDVIHAYGTDPWLPLLCDKRPYLAFEHGTIRQIPFDETTQGRLTALSYRLADGVIITNSDNYIAAQRLGLDNFRFVPHPINERWLKGEIGQKALRSQLLQELDADFLIFHPARQHWEPEVRPPSWEKGNDIFIRGLARFIHEVNPRGGAVFVEWGQKLAESKALLEELGITDRVKWIDPVPSAAMSRYTAACDLLADQFYLGAFGSTMPRALALKRLAMIYLNESIHEWCFAEMPPIINTRSPEEVFEGLRRAYQDPAWRQDLEQRGYDWYQKYHSNAIIRDKLVTFYHDVLNKTQAAAGGESPS